MWWHAIKVILNIYRTLKGMADKTLGEMPDSIKVDLLNVDT